MACGSDPFMSPFRADQDTPYYTTPVDHNSLCSGKRRTHLVRAREAGDGAGACRAASAACSAARMRASSAWRRMMSRNRGWLMCWAPLVRSTRADPGAARKDRLGSA